MAIHVRPRGGGQGGPKRASKGAKRKGADNGKEARWQKDWGGEAKGRRTGGKDRGGGARLGRRAMRKGGGGGEGRGMAKRWGPAGRGGGLLEREGIGKNREVEKRGAKRRRGAVKRWWGQDRDGGIARKGVGHSDRGGGKGGEDGNNIEVGVGQRGDNMVSQSGHTYDGSTLGYIAIQPMFFEPC